jgi:hypothetical protein
MAVVQIIAALGANDPATGVPLSVSLAAPGDPVGTLPATTTVDADVATLVADAALPTQAHVNTLNTDWGTYKTALAAYVGTSLSGAVSVSFDKATITTRRQLTAALNAVLKAVESGVGGLTP